MKKRTALFFILLSLGALLVSCSKNDDNSSSSSPSVNSSLLTGHWKITLYNDNGTNETSNYTGYDFEFKSGGSIAVTGNSTSASGTWSDGSDDSQTKLVLNFGTQSPFSDLNDDWHVIEQTSAKIRLEDVSGGNGGTDYLTFEKL